MDIVVVEGIHRSFAKHEDMPEHGGCGMADGCLDRVLDCLGAGPHRPQTPHRVCVVHVRVVDGLWPSIAPRSDGQLSNRRVNQSWSSRGPCTHQVSTLPVTQQVKVDGSDKLIRVGHAARKPPRRGVDYWP